MAIDGTYKITAKTMLGKMDGDLVLKMKNGELTGNVTGMGMSGTIKGGKVTGSNFTCQLEGDGPKGPMTLDVKGTVSDDKIKGSLKIGLMSAKFEGTRVA